MYELRKGDPKVLQIKPFIVITLVVFVIVSLGCHPSNSRDDRPVQIDDSRADAIGDTSANDRDTWTEPDVPQTPDELNEDARETCTRYIECASDASPADVPRLLQDYGANSPCWESDDTAALCARSCTAGLNDLRPSTNAEACKCRANSECLDASTRGCEISSGQCVECTSDGHCTGAASACDVSVNRCVECIQNTHCNGDTPFCRTETQQCVECLETGDCTSGLCHNNICDMSIECFTNSDCNVGLCERGICNTDCADNLSCVLVFNGHHDTLRDCLNDDTCCNIARCPKGQRIRECILNNCDHIENMSVYNEEFQQCLGACEQVVNACAESDCTP